MTDSKIILLYQSRDERAIKETSKKSENVLSDEYMAKAPALAPVLEALDLNAITPPHTKNIENFEVYSCRASGFYAKGRGTEEFFGVIKIIWQLLDHENNLYYDDFYILVSADGTQQPIDRSELIFVIEKTDDVNFEEYNVSHFRLYPKTEIYY